MCHDYNIYIYGFTASNENVYLLLSLVVLSLKRRHIVGAPQDLPEAGAGACLTPVYVWCGANPKMLTTLATPLGNPAPPTDKNETYINPRPQ